MGKITSYNDSQFYVDGKSFLKDVAKIVRNITVDEKYSYGYDLIKLIRDSITNFSKSFNNEEKVEKLKFAKIAKEKFEEIDIYLTLMKDVGVISVKQFIFLYKHFGLLNTQLTGWCKKLEK